MAVTVHRIVLRLVIAGCVMVAAATIAGLALHASLSAAARPHRHAEPAAEWAAPLDGAPVAITDLQIMLRTRDAGSGSFALTARGNGRYSLPPGAIRLATDHSGLVTTATLTGIEDTLLSAVDGGATVPATLCHPRCPRIEMSLDRFPAHAFDQAQDADVTENVYGSTAKITWTLGPDDVQTDGIAFRYISPGWTALKAPIDFVTSFSSAWTLLPAVLLGLIAVVLLRVVVPALEDAGKQRLALAWEGGGGAQAPPARRRRRSRYAVARQSGSRRRA